MVPCADTVAMRSDLALAQAIVLTRNNGYT
jgi:hypothetical protein